MAAGLRYKYQGSQVKILVGFDADSPSIAITAVTKANPAVVTYSGADLVVAGDVITIFGVGGMTELNGNVYVVESVNTGANTLELFEVDSTGYGTFTSGGHFDVGRFSNFCELTNYNRQGGSSPLITATTICSTAQEYELGLPDFGTTQLSFNFAPKTAVQGALHAFYLSGDVIAVKVILPKSGGELTQMGFVQQESETAAVGGLWTAQTTLKNTGNRFDVLT